MYKRPRNKNHKDLVKAIADDWKFSQQCQVCIALGVMVGGKPIEWEPASLHAHHVRGKKSFEIAEGVSRGYGAARIRQELDKCISICGGHHGSFHHNEKMSLTPEERSKQFKQRKHDSLFEETAGSNQHGACRA